jgi:hypothetical protein
VVRERPRYLPSQYPSLLIVSSSLKWPNQRAVHSEPWIRLVVSGLHVRHRCFRLRPDRFPEPQPQDDRLRIGDVIYRNHDGKLRFLFSAAQPLGGRERGRHVPIDFEQLDPGRTDLDTERGKRAPERLRSGNVTWSGRQISVAVTPYAFCTAAYYHI